MERRPVPVEALLAGPVAVINIGLAAFADALRGQGVAVVHLEWSPPAGGDARLVGLLDKLGA